MEILKQRTPKIAPVLVALKWRGVSSVNRNVTGIKVPRAKLGTVVATVARKFVPNCSAAIVTKIAQYPLPMLIKNIRV